MTHVLGLTGGIASGKSTVSNIFKERKIPIIDADLGARKVVEPGNPAYRKIREAFGDAVFFSDGKLDRKTLGKLIFHDEKKRDLLNQCVDEEIRNWILNERNQLIEQGHKLIVLDIPLLFEAKYEKEVDEIMVVFVDPNTQIERLMKRNNLTKKEAQERISSQMSLEKKMEQADVTIDNTKSIQETREQIVKWLEMKGYPVD